jgi:fluoroacetyl-CoA thioesterase
LTVDGSIPLATPKPPQWAVGLRMEHSVAHLGRRPRGDGVLALVALAELLRSHEPNDIRSIASLEWSSSATTKPATSLELKVIGRDPDDTSGAARVTCRLALRDEAGSVRGEGTAVLIVGADPPVVHPGIRSSLRPGATVTKDYRVEDPWLTDHVNSRLVLATPALIGFFEDAAATLANPELEDGWAIVGAAIEIRHLAPSFSGEHVSVRATLNARRGARLRYSVMGCVGSRLVGAGSVEQALVRSASFGIQSDSTEAQTR